MSNTYWAVVNRASTFVNNSDEQPFITSDRPSAEAFVEDGERVVKVEIRIVEDPR